MVLIVALPRAASIPPSSGMFNILQTAAVGAKTGGKISVSLPQNYVKEGSRTTPH